ncbi:MAG: Kef-type K+ transport system membrane component KefB [Flavobacteriales bacterium]|jgi:Kef-type K+ transport system membrane component KefB
MLLSIDLTSSYGLVIAASLIIILSYFSNFVSRKTNIPSPLLLIGLGIAMQQGMEYMGIAGIPEQNLVLEVLGTVGLIFIVLEAALDLELSKEKWPIIWKSFVVALLGLVISSFLIAIILHLTVIADQMTALVYAIPLSIMSSAIIIPSVTGLVSDKKEFMVYESTFSDILGIMFFYLLLENADASKAGAVAVNVLTNISLTLVLSVLVSYLLVFVLQKIQGQLKLFLTISVLLLLYAAGKIYHLSPLVLILVFGLMLNNAKLFWFKGLRKFLDVKKIRSITHDFHVLTLETAFVIRTFFFVIFGITIVLASLMDWAVVFYSLLIVVVLYIVRLAALFVFKRESIFPLLYIAPRGLITILLFFSITSNYPQFIDPSFNQGILLFVIIATSLIMTFSLIQNGLKPNTSMDSDVPDESSSDAGTSELEES